MTTRSTTMKRKVAVFGLDGITFDLLQPWIDQGRLPNLASVLQNKGDYEAAEPLFRQVLSIRRQNLSAKAGLEAAGS